MTAWVRLPALMSAAALAGCVTYSGFPDRIGQEPAKSAAWQDHFYTVEQGTMAGGALALNDALRARSPYGRGIHTEDQPGTGLHVKAIIKPMIPSVPAIAGFYLSVSTLTILPAWSTRDGYRVVFDVYRDGKQVDSHEYAVQRKAFLWIVMLPFVWVNALTPSEDEVFRAVADQFFQDAERHFSASAVAGLQD